MRLLYLLVIAILFTFFSTACREKEVEKEEIIIEKEIDPNANPGLIHNVYFWLKEDISETEREQFLSAMRSLEDISTVKRMFIGVPAETENRDVVDNSFDYSLQLWFDDQAGQDAYQVDPIHLKVVALKDLWTKVQVKDNLLL